MSAILTVVFDALMVVSFVSVERVRGTISLRCPVALGDCIVGGFLLLVRSLDLPALLGAY